MGNAMDRFKAKFPEYINGDFGPIGKSTSTRSNPNTAAYFYFWISRDNDTVELGNVVAAVLESGELCMGSVIELRSIMDVDNYLSDFISHDFGNPQIQPPSDIAEMIVAKAAVIKDTTDKVKPIGRAMVYFASPEGIKWALGMTEYAESGAGVPIGAMQNGDGSIVPVLLDEVFLLGPEGSHLNMSGISGLATKTSLVEFLLKSITDHVIKAGKRKIGAIFFNVKGKDLLYLDKLNPQYEHTDPYTNLCRRMYEALNIELKPFENVRVFAPYDRRFEGHTKSFRRDGKVEYFIWEIDDIVDDLPELFEEEVWDDAVEAVWADIKEQIVRQPIKTYDQLMTWLNEERRQLTAAKITHWRGHDKDTFYKTVKNIDSIGAIYDGLVCVGGVDPVTIPLSDLYNGTIFVIDIQALNDKGQRMVFNKVLKRVYQMLMDKNEKKDFDSVIFFIDELNKFAPKESMKRAPIKQSIIEICARGRSIGVSLFGVEQFMSQIDRQVVDNSSTIIYGRTGPGELSTDNYQWLSEEIRNRLTTLPRGTFLLKHAKFVQPVFVRFPYPTCVPGDQYEEEEVTKEEKVGTFGFRTDF